ncbi:MAG TPA: hypothetical protein VFO58_08800 [Vicinamibacterales bacterium]|nr:hypothetical protein [Vicinamibacterales bacterium]
MALTGHMAQPGGSPNHADAIVPGTRGPRLAGADLGESTKARLLPGGDVDVINLSGTGLLVEGRSRPVVGTTVSIRLQGCNLKRLDGRIVRSRVSTIHRDGTLSYESAIEFDRPHALEEMVNAAPADEVDRQPQAEPDEDVYILDADNDW